MNKQAGDKSTFFFLQKMNSFKVQFYKPSPTYTKNIIPQNATITEKTDLEVGVLNKKLKKKKGFIPYLHVIVYTSVTNVNFLYCTYTLISSNL